MFDMCEVHIVDTQENIVKSKRVSMKVSWSHGASFSIGLLQSLVTVS